MKRLSLFVLLCLLLCSCTPPIPAPLPQSTEKLPHSTESAPPSSEELPAIDPTRHRVIAQFNEHSDACWHYHEIFSFPEFTSLENYRCEDSEAQSAVALVTLLDIWDINVHNPDNHRYFTDVVLRIDDLILQNDAPPRLQEGQELIAGELGTRWTKPEGEESYRLDYHCTLLPMTELGSQYLVWLFPASEGGFEARALSLPLNGDLSYRDLSHRGEGMVIHEEMRAFSDAAVQAYQDRLSGK